MQDWEFRLEILLINIVFFFRTTGNSLMAAALNNHLKDKEIVLDSKDKVFM